MAAVASGQDPYHFGGRGALNDLPARLLATVRTGGADAGLFGTGAPTFDGAFRQGTALAGLAAAHVKASAVTAPLAWLTRQQCANGLWTSYRTSTATTCPAADPKTFAGPDTNSTSMAVQGLAAYGRHPRRSTLISSLNAIRTTDGGFPFLAASGQSADPDSTALSIQTLLASKASVGSAYSVLAGFQLGCADPAGDRGAFFYPGDRSPSVLATVQAVPAAAGKTLPLGPSRLSPALPTVRCADGSVAAAPAAVDTRDPPGQGRSLQGHQRRHRDGRFQGLRRGRADPLRRGCTVLGRGRPDERGLPADRDQAVRARVRLPHQQPAERVGAVVQLDPTGQRVLGLLPRLGQGDLVELRDHRAHLVQTRRRHDRGVGIR